MEAEGRSAAGATVPFALMMMMLWEYERLRWGRGAKCSWGQLSPLRWWWWCSGSTRDSGDFHL